MRAAPEGEAGCAVAALLRRAAKVRRAALVAAIPGEAGLRVDDLTYRRLARRWMTLMDVASALRSGSCCFNQPSTLNHQLLQGGAR